MNEAKMQGFFGKHLSGNPPDETAVYELKFTSGRSIRFDSLKEHQRKALIRAEDVGLYHKITDQPVFYGKRTRFHTRKPFDCFFVKCRAFVVAWFYRPRKPKVFHLIRIGDFLTMEALADRKSFTEEMAEQYSTDFMELN